MDLRNILLLQLFLASSHGNKQIPCNNQGLEWAAFRYPENPIGPLWQTFSPIFMKDPSVPGGTGTKYMVYSNVTSKVGDLNSTCSGNTTFYNSTNVIPCNYHVIHYKGYLRPSVTGFHALNFHSIEHISLLWFMDAAWTGWYRGNHSMESWFGKPWPNLKAGMMGTNATYVHVDAGTYYPIRFVHANSNSSYNFFFSVVDPLGSTLLGASTGPSDRVVRFSCDGIEAPRYNAWGKEA